MALNSCNNSLHNTTVSLNDLPHFIIETILDSIKDTKTYLVARSTCYTWFHYLKDIHIYHHGIINEKMIFSPNKIQTFFYPEHMLKNEIMFDTFGHYTKKEYSKDNQRVIKIIKNNPPYSIETIDYSSTSIIVKKKVDIRQETVTNETIPLLVPGNCLIS